MKVLQLVLLIVVFPAIAQAGAWGAGSFENDDALDWVTQCTNSRGITAVTTALNRVIDAKYIQAPDASAAIVAAEIVAASLGKPSASLPRELRTWIRQQPRDQLAAFAPVAKQALIRIQDPKVSELQQLWSDDKQSEWGTGVTGLLKRLNR